MRARRILAFCLLSQFLKLPAVSLESLVVQFQALVGQL